MKKYLAVVLAIGALALSGCGDPKNAPPQQVPASETRDALAKSVKESTTTFADGSDIVIVSLATGACKDLRDGLSKEEAIKKGTQIAANADEVKDRTTAINMGVEVYCPEFS